MIPLAIINSVWAFAALILFFYMLGRKGNRSKLPLPPGPKKLPLIGNLYDLPSERQWETYLDWSKQFNSDVIHLDVAGTSIIVLSSMEAAKELLDKRSLLYSDRAPSPMLNELMGWDFGIGERWRAHRRLLHEAFNIGAVKHFHPQKLAATHELLRRILHNPHNLMEHFRHMAGALMMDVTYGITVRDTDDPYIRIAKDAMHAMSFATIPGAFLVESIPALKYVPDWLPGAGFKRKAKEWRKVTRDLLDVPFADAKRNIAMGAAATSFTSLHLRVWDESLGKKQEREAVVQSAAANMYAAGADTTGAALGTFVLAMLANPEAQKKGQAEVDLVIGAGNLPGFADEGALPYVSAIVKEVLRWKVVTPIGVPHYIAVEDEYRGYRIPPSTVIGNTWAILHDEDMYPDPHSFKPERFLLDGKLNTAIRDPETIAFGFGRRICPGRHMATSSLWITIASILSTFHINKAVDKDGIVVEPTYEYSLGLISEPLPFECSITPRSPQAVEIIQATANDSVAS
ncbi:cytochrome P450 [Mycena polygramma]|nr:cytochrome P450 [Mycena polygramma]